VVDTLVICTKDRPDDLRRALEAVAGVNKPIPATLVVDSSTGPAFKQNAETVAKYHFASHVKCEPGLTRQRNRGVELAAGEVVHFIDDDSIVEPDYFQQISRVFTDDAVNIVGGVGGCLVGDSEPNRALPKRVFLLEGAPGQILRSGKNTKLVGFTGRQRVDWLPGCGMSYRREVLEQCRFDEALAGYAMGEDVDFSLEVRAHGWCLIRTSEARLQHRSSEANRMDVAELYRTELVNRHRRVTRTTLGGSAVAFWWSVFGQMLLAIPQSLRGTSAQVYRAILKGSARGALQVITARDKHA
jgi:GT2 family glycosyltransferase